MGTLLAAWSRCVAGRSLSSARTPATRSTTTTSSSSPGRTLGPQVYCICRGQVCAAAGQRPRLSLGPGLLATKRSLGLWRQDLAGQVGELWNGFSGARGSEGAPPWSLLPWLSLQVAVSQALGPVITIPEPGCSKTSVIFKMLLPTLYPSVLTAGRGAPRAGLVWTSERMALLYPQIHASPA